MYYGILTVSVIMFGFQFLLNNRFAERSGQSAAATFLLSLLSSVAGLICMLFITQFTVEITCFTLFAAALSACNGIAFTLCSLKALNRVRMSLFSLYSMLGGMLLPFLSGILFYGESVTIGKILCLILITLSMLLTVEKQVSKKGLLYCLGAFLFNGLSGVLAKFHESADFTKASSGDYSFWIAVMTALISLVFLLFLPKPKTVLTGRSAGIALGYGIVNSTANYLLLIALTVLPASVQYPFITGGVIAVSAVISAIRGQHPSTREIFAVIISFIGILILII